MQLAFANVTDKHADSGQRRRSRLSCRRAQQRAAWQGCQPCHRGCHCCGSMLRNILLLCMRSLQRQRYLMTRHLSICKAGGHLHRGG